jgi:hypothetical protein
VPGTRAVAFAATVPGFAAAAHDVQVGGRTAAVTVNDVSPTFFETLSIPIVRGRALDRTDKPCHGHGCDVVVSEALANQFFAGADALGGEIRLGGDALRVVGIAANTSTQGPNRPDPPMIYRPWTGEAGVYQSLVRFDGDAAAFAASVAATLRERYPAAVVDVHTLRWPLESWVAEIGGIEQLVVALAAAAALLAALGVFGVVSFAVSRREREFGIRVALGATRAQIYGAVWKSGARPVILGLTVGAAVALLAAAAFGRVLAELQFTITPFDPRLYLAAALPLALVITIAVLIPARRAARIDPLLALKQD